jgi:hypothetical protein
VYQPRVLLPKFCAKALHIFTHSPQNIAAEPRIHNLVRLDKFFVHKPLDIKESDDHLLTFVSFKTPARREQAVTWQNTAAPMHPVIDSFSFAPVLMPLELASTVLLAFSLFTLVAALLQCLCSERSYLSMKL